MESRRWFSLRVTDESEVWREKGEAETDKEVGEENERYMSLHSPVVADRDRHRGCWACAVAPKE